MPGRSVWRNDAFSVKHSQQDVSCSNNNLSGARRGVVRQLVVVTLLVSAAFEVQAVETDDTFSEMPLQELMGLEVFRSASLLPTKPAKAPGTVYSFGRDDFVRLGVRRLDDLMQFVPGFQLDQYRKRHRAIWARGLLDRYNDKLVLLVDGIRTRHLYYGHFSLGDNLPLEKIEKVEIILGPASSLYGANAFGGIISVTTREFADKPGMENSLEVADNARGKVGVLYNSPSMQAFGSYLEQDAPFRDERKSFIGGETVQPLAEEYGNVFLKSSPVDGLTFSVDYQKNNTPFLFIPNTQDAFVDEEYLTLGARYEAGDLDRGKLEGNLYYTSDKALEYEKEQVSQVLGYEEHQDATMAGATLTGFKRVHPDHVAALGLSWQYEHAENTDYVRYYHFASGFLTPPESGTLLSVPGISNNDYALYMQDVWDINPKLNLTLGGRYDDFERFGGHTNYRGALVYSPVEERTWKLLYGTAIRTPSFREYLKVLEGTSFVPPPLEPERIKSVELGFHQQWRRAALAVTLFDNKVEKYIHEVPTPDGADEYFANSTNDWHMYGVEALLRYQLTQRMSLRLGLASLEAEEESGDLPYLASLSGSVNLSYRYQDDHQAGVSLFYSSKRDDTNAISEDDPDSFVTVNLTASGNIDSQWRYQVGIDNLFDERIYDPAGDFGGQYNTERSEREIWLRMTWSPSL